MKTRLAFVLLTIAALTPFARPAGGAEARKRVPLKCTFGVLTNCGCSGPGGGGTVIADSAAETYSVMYLQRKK